MADYTRTSNETVTATDSARVNTGVTVSDLTIVLKAENQEDGHEVGDIPTVVVTNQDPEFS